MPTSTGASGATRKLGWWLTRLGAGLALAAALLVAPACTTSSEGEAMRKDIADLKTRLDAIDRRDAQYKEQGNPDDASSFECRP